MGDPYIAPLTQRSSMYKVPEALNIIDDSNMDQIAALIARCQENLQPEKEKYEGIYCEDIMQYIQTVSGQALAKDMRIFKYDWDPQVQVVTDYLTTSDMATNMTLYTQLHIDPITPKNPVFQMYNAGVKKDLEKEDLYDYTGYINTLLE